MIPPVDSIGIAVRCRILKKHQQVSAAIRADYKRIGWKIEGKLSFYFRLTHDVVACPFQTVPVAIVENRMQIPTVGASGDLTTVILAHPCDIAKRKFTPQFGF